MKKIPLSSAIRAYLETLALEVLPWLDTLRASLELGHETLLAGSRAARWKT